MATNKGQQRIANNDTKGTEVANRGPVAISTERPDYLKKGGARGRENISTEDITLPRLEIVQDLSPQTKENKAEFIPGAKSGDLINSVTKEIYPRPVLFIPVQFVKQYNLWKLRKFGGGFMGTYSSEAEAATELDLRVPNAAERDQYEILDTPVFYGLVVVLEDDGTLADLQRISISMPRTKAKHARRLNTLIDMTREDAFNRVYAISTVLDKNKASQEFYNYTIDQLPGYPNEQMVVAAEAFYKQVTSGVKIKVDQTGASAEDVPSQNAEY